MNAPLEGEAFEGGAGGQNFSDDFKGAIIFISNLKGGSGNASFLQYLENLKNFRGKGAFII